MPVARTSPLAIAAALSIAASVLLAIAPFILPNSPVWPLILANWILFMVAGYLASPKPFGRRSLQKMEPEKFRLFRLVLVAFTLAGWVAVFNAKAFL